MQIITSPHNEKVGWLRGLHQSAARRDQSLLVVEGAKEVGFALAAGFKPHSLFVRHAKYDAAAANQFNDVPVYGLSDEAFARVAYRDKTSGGVIAVFHTPSTSLADLRLSQKPFVLVVEAVEKPGNLGSIMRIADGVDADAVVVANPATDIYNPNTIRSSVGTIFSKPLIAADNQAVKEFLKSHGVAVFCAALSTHAQVYTAADFTGPTAIILGSEADGLSDFWLADSQQVCIPMRGRNDSLNVSAAAAVLAYEVLRQRS